MMSHPAEWSRRRVEILGDFYARSKNLSLISARDDYDGLELAQLGYKPVENEETEVHQRRCCSVCRNLPNLHHNMCKCTGSVMRNFLQNAMHGGRRQNDVYFGMVPYNRSTAEVRAREFGFVHRPSTEKRGRLGNGINLDYHNVQLGMKKKGFKGTFATVEIRQNMWSYRKRGNEFGESSNSERRAICARRPTLKPVGMRGRGFGRGEYEMTMELGTRRYQKPIGNKNSLTKRTRFKEDVEIMEDKIIEENNDLSESEHFGSNAIEDDSDSHSCHDSNDENDVDEIPTQRDLEDKLKQLYEYILSSNSPSVEIECEKPEDTQDNFDTINLQQEGKKLPSQRKSSGMKRHVKKGIYRKVEVVLKRPRMKIDEGCLREYIEMQKRMNELMNRMLKEEDKSEEYDENQEECEAVNVDEDISSNIIPKRSHLKVHLQSFFTEEDGNANGMHKDSVPSIPDFPRVDENFPLKVNKKLTILSGDDTADETDSTKETHTKDEVSVYSSSPDSTENKSRRGSVRRLLPIQPISKQNFGKNGRSLSTAYGQSKSLPPSPTPSKAVMRRQVKCILRRSPPGTSLRRVDTRRSHQTHTVARKVVSRSELISHSEHTGHYYTTQDSMLPFQPISNKKKGTSLPGSACENNSGLFRSLRSRSFSSSVKISRLERGLSYQTMGNSNLDEILSPEREQGHNLEDISFRGHSGNIFNSPLFSTKDGIIWDAPNVKSKSNAYKGNKGLVVETFKDVLEYIQERKPPDDIFRADVVHNTPSSYSVNNHRCKTYSPGCQVLESFFDLIKYLRQIKAASQLPCSRYHTPEHGVAPNPEGDAKEYSRTPFKFASKRKHVSDCDRGSLVLEAFREVLKLMKEEEEYIEIPNIHCESTESAFPKKTDKNFLFFELHNGKLFSDSKVDSSEECSSETSCPLPTLNCENNLKSNKLKLESEKSMVSSKKSPVMKKSPRKRGKRELKESNLRHFFSLPLLDNMKRAFKEGTLTKNKHEKLNSKKRERKIKVDDDIKNVQDYTKTVNTKTTNKINKSKHRTDVHKRFSEENSGSKTGVQVTEKHKECKEGLIQNKRKESKENKVETNLIDKKSTTRLNNSNKANLRGAADGEACGPSKSNILIRLDEKCKLGDTLCEFGGTSKDYKTSVAYGESDGPSHVKSLPRFDDKFKLNAMCSKFCGPSTSQMLTGLDEKPKLGVNKGEFNGPNNTKCYTTFDEKCKSGTTLEESFCRNYAKSLTGFHGKCESSAAGSESCKPRKAKNITSPGEKRKLGIAENELCGLSNFNISSRFHEKCTSRTADGESRAPSNVQSLPSFDKKWKSDPTCGESCAPRNAKIDNKFDKKSQLGTKYGETSSSSNAQTSVLVVSDATSGKCSGSNQGRTLSSLDGKNTSGGGKSWSPSNVKSLSRFEEKNDGSDVAKSCGRSTKSLTIVDSKSKSHATDGESCVSNHTKTKWAENGKSKPRIPPANDRKEIRFDPDEPQTEISLRTSNGSTEIYPPASKYSCNKDLPMGKKSQREPVNKDCPPKKMQRNAKALEKIASGRYCHFRRRQEEEEDEPKEKRPF